MGCLKDMGYLAIDNLPYEIFDALLKRVKKNPERYFKLAIGIDVGDSEFIDSFSHQVYTFSDFFSFELVFLRCEKRELLRRYAETRRKHPLSDQVGIDKIIDRELELLQPLQSMAKHTIPTTRSNIHQLKQHIQKLYGATQAGSLLHIELLSFGYKYGIPEVGNALFDIRFLKNPYFVPKFRNETGLNDEVYDYVISLPEFAAFFKHAKELLHYLIPLYEKEGKFYLSFAFGCTGGKHRSVSTCRKFAEWIGQTNYSYSVVHRDIDKN